ncbi:MAG: adenylosuccinate lyase [Chloroflexi bacterium]|nr:adenylosuccinate lyase [Chloroflexota bacterium]
MELLALSPLDGRYQDDTAPLRDHFSEHAFHRARIHLELEYLKALSGAGLCPSPDPSWETFHEPDGTKIAEIEKTTHHDVKAIEYYLRELLPREYHPWIHFGLTSEDINNLAIAVALKESRDQVMLPALDALLDRVRNLAAQHRSLPILARTHGQPAVPSTLGKEMAVYLARLSKCRSILKDHVFEGKLNGAVGNFNSLKTASPEVDWISFSKEFASRFGLQPNLVTTQILPYDNWIRYFLEVALVNRILIGYTQDIWHYLSTGILCQKITESEIGSSTMPQKVNPIHFENAEGNLGIACALITHYSEKLLISRLQRDLSDSTIRRTFGSALGHSLIAWKQLARGIDRLEADAETASRELQSHWEVLGEAAQTILRAARMSDAFESLKSFMRGRVFSEAEFKSWIESLEVEEEIREQLNSLTPQNYVGAAEILTDIAIRESQTGLKSMQGHSGFRNQERS